MVNGEDLLSPTARSSHSTHNTIAAQIAYLLKCRGYNNTFSHRNISFESALLDAQLQDPGAARAASLLVGGIDELTDTSFTVLSRLKTFKSQEPGGPLDELYETRARRAPGPAKGPRFLWCRARPGPRPLAQLLAVRTVSFSTPEQAAATARQLLAAQRPAPGRRAADRRKR